MESRKNMRAQEFISENTQYTSDQVQSTAQRMIDQYQGLKYSPRERANDHAQSYESNTLEYRYWCAVADEITRLQKAQEQALSEGTASQYEEIEFVCVNPQFPDATDPELQQKMYRELKKLPGVIPLLQDWGDYSEGQMSLSAIYKDPSVKKLILKLAKSLGVQVDLIQPVTDDYVDRAIRGDHEGQSLSEEDQPVLKLGDTGRAKALEWIKKVYAKYPYVFNRNHVMAWGEGDNQELAMFDLEPSFSKRGAVEVKWFQAYPLRQGIGSRAMQELQTLAREDGITLTLFPWDKGQVSQAKLMKFYRSVGFNPITKGGKNMYWSPELDEAVLDPHGWGATPMGVDIDYFGFKVKMRPSMFLKLAAPLTASGENSEVAHHMERGGKIAYPILIIEEPQEWEEGDFSKDAKIASHEGRNRMKKWLHMHGDEPIQVNMFFRNANRSRYITPQMIKQLRQGVFNEVGNYVVGPLF